MRSLIFTLAMVAGTAASAFAAAGMGYVVEVDGRPAEFVPVFESGVHEVRVVMGR